MTIILGPCRCQGCGRVVFWATGGAKGRRSGQVARWRNESGRTHSCRRPGPGGLR